LFRDAQIIAERRRALLRDAQIPFLDDWDFAFKIFQRLQVRRMKSSFIPFALVEPGVLVGVSAKYLQSLKDSAFALLGRHGLALCEPVTAFCIGKIVVVVGGRKEPGFHRAAHRGPRSATSFFSVSMMACGGVSCSITSFTPIFFSAATSSSGITPPATTIMSSAPSFFSLSKIFR